MAEALSLDDVQTRLRASYAEGERVRAEDLAMQALDQGALAPGIVLPFVHGLIRDNDSERAVHYLKELAAAGLEQVPEETRQGVQRLHKEAVELRRFHRDALERLPRLDDPEADDLLKQGLKAEETKRFFEAEQALRDVLLRVGEHPFVLWRLGHLNERVGRVEEARRLYDRSLSLQDSAVVRILRETLLPASYVDMDDLLAWRRSFEAGLDRLEAADFPKGEPIPVFPRLFFRLAYQGFNDKEPAARFARILARAFPALAEEHSAEQNPFAMPVRRDGRVRVGFVSNYFHNQTVGSLMAGIIEALPRDRFHVTIIGNASKGDRVGRTVRARAQRNLRLSGVVPRDQAMIAGLDLDVLVFNGVAMDSQLYSLGMRRLAKRQAVFWGHPVTTGLPSMDDYLSFEGAETPQADDHYTERLVRFPMPTIHFADPVEVVREAQVEKFDQPATAETLYLCFQTIYKMHPRSVALLRSVLEADPGGHLVLMSNLRDPNYERRHAQMAEAFGALWARVHLVPFQKRSGYFDLVRRCDVVLDTSPFCGGQTTLEAIALDKPVVTLSAEFRRGRLSEGYLRFAGRADLVAESEAEYARLALVAAGEAKAARAAGTALYPGPGGQSLFGDIGFVEAFSEYLAGEP